MKLCLIDLPPVRLACLRYTGPYGPAIGAFWREIFFPWLHLHQLGGPTCYGIALDDPRSTAPEQCRYDAGVEVPASFEAEMPASMITLPGGRYAVAPFRGAACDIGAAWIDICQRLIPTHGLQNDARPCFERYLPGPRIDPESGFLICEICIAVR